MRATERTIAYAEDRESHPPSLEGDPIFLLDASVFEVFGLMVGLPCVVARSHASPRAGAPKPMGKSVCGASAYGLSDMSDCSDHSDRPGGSNADANQSSPQMAAIVGFAGAMCGTCVLRVSAAAARRMAGAMLGTDAAQLEATVADALGELCNMVAGGWKSRIPSLAAGCLLSVPAVISGPQRHRIHVPAQRLRHDRVYCFEGHPVSLTLLCERLR